MVKRASPELLSYVRDVLGAKRPLSLQRLGELSGIERRTLGRWQKTGPPGYGLLAFAGLFVKLGRVREAVQLLDGKQAELALGDLKKKYRRTISRR